MTTKPLTPAEKKAADAKAKVAAEIAAKTGSNPSANGSQDFSTGSTNYQSWEKVVSGSTFDMSKFPEPTLSKLGTAATGEQVLQALSRLVSSNPGLWQNLRPTILALGGQVLPKNKINKPWTSTDETAIKDWLATTHYNAIDLTPGNKTPYTPPDLFSGFTSGMQNIKKFGTVGSKVTVAPLVPVHSSADLADAAQKAFASTLGRSATPAEAETFTKAFQSLENSYGQAKNDAKKQSVFSAPAQPIQFQQPGQSAVPAQSNVSTDSGAIQVPPTPDIAASNFAAQTHPVEAGASALADTVNKVLTILKG